MTSPTPPEAPGPVLLFDRDCGLCRRVVVQLLRLDRRGRLRFAPLQGPAAQAYLRAQGLPAEDFDSLVFVPDWARRAEPDFLLRTDGALAALRTTGGFGRSVAAVAAVLPHAWRDAAYRGVARTRRRWFGATGPAPWTQSGWAERFLA